MPTLSNDILDFTSPPLATYNPMLGIAATPVSLSNTSRFATDLGDVVNTGGTGLVFSSSSGTTNVGAVPEPASWALMIAGFAMIGAAMRLGETAFAE